MGGVVARKILIEVEVPEGIDEEVLREAVRKMFRQKRIFGMLKGWSIGSQELKDKSELSCTSPTLTHSYTPYRTGGSMRRPSNF